MSDAGLLYFMATGDQAGTHDDLQDLFGYPN